MTEMQQIDGNEIYVPEWFVRFYDSGYIWLAGAAMGIILIVLIVIICFQYYEWKEAKDCLNKHIEKNKQNNRKI